MTMLNRHLHFISLHDIETLQVIDIECPDVVSSQVMSNYAFVHSLATVIRPVP